MLQDWQTIGLAASRDQPQAHNARANIRGALVNIINKVSVYIYILEVDFHLSLLLFEVFFESE